MEGGQNAKCVRSTHFGAAAHAPAAFTRTLTTLYTMTLLSLLIHIQVNLLGRLKYVHSVIALAHHERAREVKKDSLSVQNLLLGLAADDDADGAGGVLQAATDFLSAFEAPGEASVLADSSVRAAATVVIPKPTGEELLALGGYEPGVDDDLPEFEDMDVDGDVGVAAAIDIGDTQAAVTGAAPNDMALDQYVSCSLRLDRKLRH